MTRLRATISAHALVVQRTTDGAAERLLMVRLAYGDHRWRKWAFPGGYVDQGEALETALCREVLEEIGIRLVSWERVAVLPFLQQKHPHVGFVYLCDNWEGEPQQRSRELLETAWFTREAFHQAERAGELAYGSMAHQVACLGWRQPER